MIMSVLEIYINDFIYISKTNKCKNCNRALRLNMCMKNSLEFGIEGWMLLSKKLKSVEMQ